MAKFKNLGKEKTRIKHIDMNKPFRQEYEMVTRRYVDKDKTCGHGWNVRIRVRHVDIGEEMLKRKRQG